MELQQHPDPQFKISEETLKEFLEQGPKPFYFGEEFILTQEMAVNQPFDRLFKCSICLNVLSSPISQMECCEQLYCQTCILDWKKFRQACPNCKAVLKIAPRPNRIVMNILNEILFICKFC